MLNRFDIGGVPYEGQYIAAGFTGHGMPRAFGWFVYSSCMPTLVTIHLSADIVAQMIWTKITGDKWELPSWLPIHYLTNLDKFWR